MLEKFKSFTKKVFIVTQRILTIISLFIVYFLVFGIMVVFMFIFKFRFLKGISQHSNSFWVEAKGYKPIFEECLRQS